MKSPHRDYIHDPMFRRLCLEAWDINASPCALNRDDGSYLPQEYLHLVRKRRHQNSTYYVRLDWMLNNFQRVNVP